MQHLLDEIYERVPIDSLSGRLPAEKRTSSERQKEGGKKKKEKIPATTLDKEISSFKFCIDSICRQVDEGYLSLQRSIRTSKETRIQMGMAMYTAIGEYTQSGGDSDSSFFEVKVHSAAKMEYSMATKLV